MKSSNRQKPNGSRPAGGSESAAAAETLLTGNVYDRFPQYYDLLYRRYLRSVNDFVDLVAGQVRPGGSILDLAAGTGEVSVPLAVRGFQIRSLDMNPGMLRQLRRKAREQGAKVRVTVMDMNDLTLPGQAFDGICIRQAINYYLGAEQLLAGLVKIRGLLKPNGVFVFNAPNHRANRRHYPPVASSYDDGPLKAFVLETNSLDGRLLTHRQDSVIWGRGLERPVHLTDSNSFYMFTRAEFQQALAEAGFSRVEMLGPKLAPLGPKDRTIYCLARP